MSETSTRSQPEHLSRLDIEQRANHMVDYILPERGNDITPPDLQRIVSTLESEHRIGFCFSEALGSLPTGARIMGMFAVDPLTIHVSSDIPAWSPGFCMTLAHELGHLALHRKMLGKGNYISREKPLVDTAKQLRYRETAELSDLGWVEWQANEFAMCLILPRRYLQLLVCLTQHSHGIRNIGTMYLDDNPWTKADCAKIVTAIAETTAAKESLIWRRLRFLGILEDHQKIRSQSIFEDLNGLFRTED